MARLIALALGVAALLLPDGAATGIDRLSGGLATVALLACGGWAALLTIALVAVRLPSAAGAWGRQTARWLLPAALHGLLGLTAVGLLPAAALADPADPPILIDRIPSAAVASTVSSQATGVPGPPTPARQQLKPQPQPTVVRYVVAAGDSLWTIAAAELPPDAGPAAIDARWRKWWQHNRAAIGDDPHLIHVGLRLTAPPADGP